MSKTENKSEVLGLEGALSQIKKKFGGGAVMILDDSSAAEPVDVISTGNDAINEMVGIGGIPRGRVTEIFGPEAGGKTTLALQIVAQAQQTGGLAAYIDAEHALDPDYARKLGVDTSKLLISQPSCGEEALEIAEALIRSGAVTVVVVDSVAALVPRSELEGEIGDAQMGVVGRMMSQAMRKLTRIVSQTNTALVFINQIRDKLGVMFGSPETTPGGRALKFFSSLRLDVRRISSKKKGDTVIGNEVRVKSAKNKLSAPFRTVDITLLFGQGFINE